jgi:hypothetical protein
MGGKLNTSFYIPCTCNTNQVAEKQFMFQLSDIPSSKTQKFSNSFFVKTIIDWNHLEDSVVCATSVESFKSALTNRQ